MDCDELTMLRRISMLHWKLQSISTAHLQAYGLSGGLLPFLWQVHRYPGLHMDALSQRLRVDKAATTKAIQKLVSQGLVEKTRDPEDRRYFRLALTALGARTAPACREAYEGLNEQVLSGFSREERAELEAMLRRMWQNLSESARLNCCAGVTDIPEALSPKEEKEQR